jgi:hypothetical protein
VWPLGVVAETANGSPEPSGHYYRRCPLKRSRRASVNDEEATPLLVSWSTLSGNEITV